jgi:hypothetical protein
LKSGVGVEKVGQQKGFSAREHRHGEVFFSGFS